MKDLISRLIEERTLSDNELKTLLETEEFDELLHKKADNIRREIYGIDVYVRGLIEFTNCCKNDCYYCGIRKSNLRVNRYRLSEEEILKACKMGYEFGFRTFVLQGGEDPFFTDEKICSIVSHIRKEFPDCAITLSIGEKSKDSYKAYFDAGANRYLLRHESASELHYSKLHPDDMKLENRKRCLYDLKEIGYQVGAGFMVGSPFQKTEDIISDLHFLKELKPDMIGIGPFISHCDTPFSSYKNGSLKLTLRLISILRIMFPYALIPATTALGTVSPIGRELGLKAGANVVMPNLTPKEERNNYLLYDNKICIGEDLEFCSLCIEQRVKSAGYHIVTDIGDVKR